MEPDLGMTPMSDPSQQGRLVVGVPTVGRAEILVETVRAFADQTRLPDLVLICVAAPEDAGGLDRMDLPFKIKILTSAKGLTRQRNRILNALNERDLLVFLDDDFLMAPDYLQRVETIFHDHPDVVMITGTVIADGILGPGLDHYAGGRLLQNGIKDPAPEDLNPAQTGYGCNMSVRLAPVLRNELFFDEKLPPYRWLEDLDFSDRLRDCGRFVKPAAVRGVHLGTKTGRTPGVFLGYSQIANPMYLIRKGTISRKQAYQMIMRHLASNMLRTVFPVAWADYRGRLRGNAIAVMDLITRRSAPDRILTLKP